MAKHLVYFFDADGDHLVDVEVPDEIRDLPDQLFTMADRLGVDLAAVESDAQLAALQTTCRRCAAHAACRLWAPSSDPDGYRAFCPNVDILDRRFVVAAVSARAAGRASAAGY
jgi:hypothetical protein